MARSSNKTTLLFNLGLMLPFLLIASVVKSRPVLGSAAASTPECVVSVHGVATGDTCTAVEKQFDLTGNDFKAINPNLDCDKLLVGQWLCVEGTSN